MQISYYIVVAIHVLFILSCFLIHVSVFHHVYFKEISDFCSILTFQMSIGANIVMRPQNAASAALIRFVPHFVGLRLSWTQNSLKSEGVEQFVEEFLPIIRLVGIEVYRLPFYRENNPQIKYFLQRTYTECDPFVVGE